ncbi:MAG: glutathione S-transferase C-terminal domain-containing protein [Cyanobacteria bacterium J06638_7]
MLPPPWLVRTARSAWHWQWLQLMGGLGPADAQGRYRRPAAAFSETADLPDDAAEADAHVLIVGRSCPWAHRAWLVWALRRLEDTITLAVVEPDPEAGRWRFPEPFEGCATLAELYGRSGAAAGSRATVPLLYAPRSRQVVVGESARLIELLNRWPSRSGLDLDPPGQRQATASWRHRLQGSVNDGVYRCGFARSQAAYDAAEADLFATLEAADGQLAASAASTQVSAGGASWLSGPQPSLADVQLFPTLIRLESVYAPLFGVSRLPLWQLPALWAWRARFHQLQGVAETCWPDAWRQDYFGALFPLHPSGIVPAGPPLATLVGSCPRPRSDAGQDTGDNPPGHVRPLHDHCS